MRLLDAAWWTVGKAVAACLIVGTSALFGCADRQTEVVAVASHTLTIQVQDLASAPVPNVNVTAWIIDVDLPGEERVPIELGTASTDAQGQVRFAYTSGYPPYVCGWRVWAPGSAALLAEHAPEASDNLSQNGYTIALVP